ncbi:hypothetical protein PanWU01x14_344350 [Parasponia andersonii]|uniref:Uncharacterized protein n=1 Tax=Parasponia andersonii TaxID=3476 RepID=A0A2P5AD17_PARAD|nr:hypothetical protein PanWU01x14_344350 [Parasponia andersonii]
MRWTTKDRERERESNKRKLKEEEGGRSQRQPNLKGFQSKAVTAEERQKGPIVVVASKHHQHGTPGTLLKKRVTARLAACAILHFFFSVRCICTH